MMTKAVVIYSGGMDSYTLLSYVCRSGYNEVHALSFDYGQRHKKELEYARRVTREQGIPHKVVDITAINSLLQGSSLTQPDLPVPEGHYAEPTMKQTVVPNRNMIMLSLAVGYAVSIKAIDVFYGAHAGDHAIYPDCRGEFIDAMNAVTRIANFIPVTILAPFLSMDKGDIAILGKNMRLDYSQTWTCYKGEALPCGKCGACVERAEAMAKAGIVDVQS